MPDFSEHIVRVQRFHGNAYGVGRVADAEQEVLGEHIARREEKYPPPVAVAIRSHDVHSLDDMPFESLVARQRLYFLLPLRRPRGVQNSVKNSSSFLTAVTAWSSSKSLRSFFEQSRSPSTPA